MGLDANVYCRCWQDGRAAPPDMLRDRVGFDEEGYLGIIGGGDPTTWPVLDDWLETACPHKHMYVADEHLSNWAGLRQFQTALETVGWTHFPTLRDELPSVNGGRLPVAAAARMLAELRDFAGHAEVGTETVLLDADTEAVVTSYIEHYTGTYLYLDQAAGVAPDGFFVRDDSGVLFQSMRFTQQDGELRDLLDAEQRVRWFMRDPLGDGASSFRVVTRPLTPAHFDYIVTPLTRVCEASVETGNPVNWA